MRSLTIRHISGTVPPLFQVERPDQKSAIPVSVPSPSGFSVSGRPDSNLMQELRWYLEDFLEYPFSPNTERAECALEALKGWGRQTFGTLFGSRDSGRMFDEASCEGYENLHLKIMSDDSGILQWPWEALLDPEATYLSVASQIERSINQVRDPIPIPEGLPRDRITILLVTARPYENDVPYRSISRPLVELITKSNIPAEVHVLRPPTLANLLEHLTLHPHFYHVLHFDGHGGYGERSMSDADPFKFRAPEGVLVFENQQGKPDEVTAEQLSGLLLEHAIPVVVLNACRSAMLDQRAQDPFASVAASLLKAGVRSVVAMAYSLWLSGAQQFLSAFYKGLFQTGNPSRATRSGRQKMFEQRRRICARGRYELCDFIVPVIYQQEDFQLPMAYETRHLEVRPKSSLPEEAQDKANPYGFIGRDRELLCLERAMRMDTPAILIQGFAGIGKTTLVRGFVKWLHDTRGMDGCLWLDFRDVRSAEYVINAMGRAIAGQAFLTASVTSKVETLCGALRERRLLVIWDNFEVVAGIPDLHVSANMPPEDRGLLLFLLEGMRGSKSKVIITSRSDEEWLGVHRLRISIGGLVGEERWEYCETILSNLGLTIDRNDPSQVELMELLGGHPLAMRVILPRLEEMTPRQVVTAIRTEQKALGIAGDSLDAVLQFAHQRIAGELQQLLIPLALHERYVDASLLQRMARNISRDWTDEKVERCLRALGAAGLLRNVGGGVFELHPALTGFLRATLLRTESDESRTMWSRAFIGIMGRTAIASCTQPGRDWHSQFTIHGANFHAALAEAERLNVAIDQIALTQALAFWALSTHSLAEARDLLSRHARVAASTENPRAEGTAYQQLATVARQQEDLKAAEQYYQKAEAIFEAAGIHNLAALVCDQLAAIAKEQGNLLGAEEWCHKSLSLNQKLGNEKGMADAYHQLGTIVEERGESRVAEECYHKSLHINERIGNRSSMATDFQQLGRLARERGDLKGAQDWYLRALEICEENDDDRGKANLYTSLKQIAEETHDGPGVKRWQEKETTLYEKHGVTSEPLSPYHMLWMMSKNWDGFHAGMEKSELTSLTINQMKGNERLVAKSYEKMSMTVGAQGHMEESCKWLIKAIEAFARVNDAEGVERNTKTFVETFSCVFPEERPEIRRMWDEAGLGAFPDVPSF